MSPARYRGGLQAAIFDWAGTTVDFGCLAPVQAFLAVFKSRGLTITAAQARLPMGLHKRDHIRAITRMQEVASAWQRRFGKPCSEADIDALYHDFVPAQLSCLAAHTALIPGALELVTELRRRGLRIGSTTGYAAEMMAVVAPAARALGYAPDCVICASDVTVGRPAPFMCFANAERLRVYPMAAVVKIGDTVADVEEGLNAGAWTIALAACGNEVGLSERELAELPAAERSARIAAARARLSAAGAHYVVDFPTDCLPIIDEIQSCLRSGERP